MILQILPVFAEKYFYDPNSPFRNEDLYLPVAKGLASYGGLSPERRSAYGHTASMCSLNPVGQRAADFRFSDAEGKVLAFIASLDRHRTQSRH